MALDADTIYGFVGSILHRRFDNPQPTPAFHKEMWELCCSSHRQVALAAPRGHAKSTAITHAYTLANVLFRERCYVIVVSDTEEQAIEFLSDIKLELKENVALIELFGIKKVLKDTETVVVCEFDDGEQFRIIAKGAEQKVRGRKWRGKRPDLIVVDDLENDELVMNKDRREKLRKWFFSALLPSLSKNGIIRVVGTVLHMDSLLERLLPPIDSPNTVEKGLKSYSLNPKAWVSYRYKAHNEDFSLILWPEMWSKELLLTKRQEYIEQGMPEGYAQEYLNYPIDESTAYFRREDFKPIRDYSEHLNYYAAVDFAIGEKERADYTVIAVCGMSASGKLKVVDIRRGRWNSLEIIDEMFSIQGRYSPDLFTVENEKITKALGPFLYAEMHKRGVFLNLNPQQPTKDKQARARSLQARMKAGGVEFDMDASWYPDLQSEMIRFPRDKHDDQVDALSWVGLTLDKVIEAKTPIELEEEAWLEEYEDSMTDYDGHNLITGY